MLGREAKRKVVRTILEKIAFLPEDKKETDILIRVESQIAFANLKDCLQSYISAEKDAADITFEAIFTLVSERSKGIDKTDACHVHHPDTRANRAWLIVGEEFAVILNNPVYDFLMPPLKSIQYRTTKGNLSSLKFHEFILGDDGTPIEVGACLDKALKDKTTILFHTCGNDGKSKLSDMESDRVRSHSHEAVNYYNAISSYVKANVSVRLDAAQKKFHETMQSGACQITATYKDAGKKRLAKYLLSNVHSPLELTNLMSMNLLMNEWKVFLGCISNEDLFRIMLEIGVAEHEKAEDKLDVLLKEKKIGYARDEMNIRALLFCLNKVYGRARAAGPEFASTLTLLFGASTASIFKAYPKTKKMIASEILADFFISEKKLNELCDFLKEKSLEEYEDVMITGTLGLITDLAKTMGNRLNESRYGTYYSF